MERLTAAVAAVGALAIAVIMVLTVADVLRRTLTDRSIQGVIEVAPLLLLSAAALGMGYAEQIGVHVRTSMVTSRLPRVAALAFRSAGSLVSLVVLAWVAWEALDRAIASIQNSDVTPGFVAYPTWPAQVLVPVGFALFAVHVCIRLVDDVRALRSGEAFEEVEDEFVLEATHA
ncbi:TRAP transporter small permease [Nocardioides hwasunensis]|uniref:TRAP transporter small permease n=1 Tax=Nocardioides hwasunensis TaxID=397258 RepID=A0ABR8MMG0_9ACTN|nr:TRAP transporter small permease [Nocardioides hwasunensis]MBD3916750.1 TRAP transporter small permease [Nocardioides hwasunensis]